MNIVKLRNSIQDAINKFNITDIIVGVTNDTIFFSKNNKRVLLTDNEEILF